MEIPEYREQIDQIDNELLQLFNERMGIARHIALEKKKAGIPLRDTKREREKLAIASENADAGLRSSARILYSTLLELSRSYQGAILDNSSGLGAQIAEATQRTGRIFPQHASVACQGVEGSYSQLACERLFAESNIFHFSSFDAVFSAVNEGLCQYGVVPLENSTAGSVTRVYDLMMRNNFKIVRSVRIKIDHSLFVKPGTKPGDIREIFSHEQALQQCAQYLKQFDKTVLITPVANTAEAAKRVAESDRNDVAALSSRMCGAVYGLTCLDKSVQDKGNNYTRFICISQDLEIYPGADRTSIMLTTTHTPGALFNVLGCIYALGINIVKLESRPIPDRDFEFMFYFDLETSVYSEQFSQLMKDLENTCEEFYYLGSFIEKV